MKNLKHFIDVDGIFYVYKMVEIHHKKNSVTSLIIILKVFKNMDKVYNDFKN
jgi:hypothetical protein